ncbi:hypothetical protein HU200_019994 [Digitaria exilis]|uniref:SB domain-containing protein n=1 Tax=Digitaria exilis TaxID=1010633 RepID=A0A835F197_9POAL|nr:hypothetical protein HU200_019994 [Digitaria exilis]CAB3463441.1 unnamed protein product [Digitaria exilis]
MADGAYSEWWFDDSLYRHPCIACAASTIQAFVVRHRPSPKHLHPAVLRPPKQLNRPFVDYRTGRIHRRTLPYLHDGAVPSSSLAGLIRTLGAALRTRSGGGCAWCWQGRDAMASLQAVFRERGHAMGAAARELEEDRMRLEHAVTASLAHRGKLLACLHEASHAPPDDVGLAGAARGRRKAAELAVDDAIDTLGRAMENGELSFQEYIRRVKILARGQFFHCYAASTSMGT